MTAGSWFLQAAYATGFVAMMFAGSKHRIRERLGWFLAVASEALFAAWATFNHVPGAYPWIAAWTAVYVWNWRKWSTGRHIEHA